MKQFYYFFFLLTYTLGFSQNNPCFPTEYFAYMPVSAQNTNSIVINESYPEILLISSQGTFRFDYTITVTENFEISLNNSSGYGNSISENSTNRVSAYVRRNLNLPNGSYTGKLYIFYNGSNTPCEIDLSTQVTLTNTDFITTNFQIYPNPTSDVINFSEPIDLSLFNIQGSKISEFEKAKSISISNLPSGIYFLNTKKFGSHKIIKQ